MLGIFLIHEDSNYQTVKAQHILNFETNVAKNFVSVTIWQFKLELTVLTSEKSQGK